MRFLSRLNEMSSGHDDEEVSLKNSSAAFFRCPRRNNKRAHEDCKRGSLAPTIFRQKIGRPVEQYVAGKVKSEGTKGSQ